MSPPSKFKIRLIIVNYHATYDGILTLQLVTHSAVIPAYSFFVRGLLMAAKLKLTDQEFIERHRAANRKRANRQRERLTQGGKTSVTLWMPIGVKQRLADAAAAKGMTMAALATSIIEMGLN